MRFKSGLVALLALLAVTLFSAPAANAADAGWRDSGPLSDVAGIAPVAVDYAPDGTAYAVWSKIAMPAFTGTVYVATKEHGGQWSEETEVGAGLFPKVDVGPDGTPYVVYSTGTYIAATGVEVAVPDGDEWQATSIGGAYTAIGGVTTNGPKVIAAPDGTVTVGWTSANQVVFATKQAGQAWGAPEAVYSAMIPGSDPPTPTGSLNGGFEMAADGAGAITAVVRDGGASSSHNGVRTFTRGTPTGTWSTATPSPSGDSSGNHYAPQVAVAPSGATVVTWSTSSPTSGYRAAVRNEGSSTFGPVRNLTTTGGGIGVPAAVTYLANGEALLAWQIPAAGSDPSRIEAVRLRHRRGAADIWNPVTTVVSSTGALGSPSIVADPAGGATAIWQGVPESGPAAAVFASRVGSGSDEWGPAEQISTDEAPASFAAGNFGGAAVGPTGDIEAIHLVTGTGLAGSTYERNLENGATWTAHGLTGTLNLRTWINYLGGIDGVVAEAGATRSDQYDPYRYGFTYQDAWKAAATGETVIQLKGTIKFVYPTHFIDMHIVDPQIRIAADGRTGALIADGQASGSMEDAIAGNPKTIPFEKVKLLDLDLNGVLPVASADGATQTWSGIAAKIAGDPAPEYLSYEAGSKYGFFTVTVPSDLRTVTEPTGPGPDPDPDPDPEPTVRKTVRSKAWLTGSAKVRAKARKKVGLRLEKQLGDKAGVSFKVKLVRGKKVIATGVLKGKKLNLVVKAKIVKKKVKGKKRKVKRKVLPKLKGSYKLLPVNKNAAMNPAILSVR